MQLWNRIFLFNLLSSLAEYQKPDAEHPDYYCKWENLSYAEATWEDGALIVKKWPTKIKEFRDREDSKRTPSKHCKVLKTRPKFHHVKTQPSYMGKEKDLVLRDYQMDGLNWMILSWCKENRCAVENFYKRKKNHDLIIASIQFLFSKRILCLFVVSY